MVEDIPKSTGKQPKYPEAPLLFISGTHCSSKRRRIFCQGLGQQASLFCHSRRLWAEGSSPLWQDFHRGDNQLRLGPGFRWNCVSASLGPGFGWNCISVAGVQVELHLCPQVSSRCWWCEAVCYNFGVQKANPATFAYLFVRGGRQVSLTGFPTGRGSLKTAPGFGGRLLSVFCGSVA